MKLVEALECLGSNRVIWIDDHFNETPPLQAQMLADKIEVTESCGFPEFAALFAGDAPDDLDVPAEIDRILTRLEPIRRDEISDLFLKRQQEMEGAPARELPTDAFETCCSLLGVKQEDRWSFKGYEAKLRAVVADGDEGVSFIVDIKDSGNAIGDDTRGLDVLRNLATLKSKATAFVLTHEATIAQEATREREYQADLERGNFLGSVPLCVISKERLAAQPTEPTDTEEALRVAIKRAGLRRSIHEVLIRARSEVDESFKKAAQSLLRVPAEKLDDHVVERGYQEGVSELHVIERALTAEMSRSIRSMFGRDPQVHDSTRRLRTLRSIPLSYPDPSPDPDLTEFRKAEIWEGEELINEGLAPIACGDVFEIDRSEASTKGLTVRKRFVLVGQPCDIMLRPQKGRAARTAILMPLKAKAGVANAGSDEDGPGKSYPLPFKLDGENLVCDIRDAATVQLAILDLASLRQDGVVRFDRGQAIPPGLLAGLATVFESWNTKAARLMPPLDGAVPPAMDRAAHHDLQLAFAAPEAFKHVAMGTFEAGTPENRGTRQAATVDRLTWRLRRCGRVRMPYAAAILDRYVGTVNRHAFDLDYMQEKAAKELPRSAGLPSAQPRNEAVASVTT